MSVYKSRPQTSMGWTEMEGERDQMDDRPSRDSPDGHVSGEEGDDWKSAVASAIHVAPGLDMNDRYGRARGDGRVDSCEGNGLSRSSATRKSIRDNIRHKQSHDQAHGQGQVQGQGQVPTQGHGPITGQGPSGLDSRLLARKTTRPRTATGIQSSRGKNTLDTDQHGELENNVGQERQRPARASAPATISRVRRISWEPGSKSNAFLPEHKQAGMLGGNNAPSYAARPKQSKFPVPGTNPAARAPSRGALDATNSLIISSMNPQVRGSKESLTMEQRYTVEHNGKLPREYSTRDTLSREAMTRESRLDNHLPGMGDDEDMTSARRVAVLKLPPLEVGLSSSSAHRTHGYGHSQTTHRALSRQADHEYLTG